MAYPIYTGDIAEITIRTTVCAQTCLSIFHYRLDTPSTIADGGAALLQLMNALNVDNALADQFARLCAENVDVNELRGQMISASRWNPISITPISDLGTYVGDCNNPAAAAAFTKRAETATRIGRGTLHMPGVADTAIANGFLVNGYATIAANFKTAIATTLTPATGRTWIPVIYSRSNPANSQPIVSVGLQDSIRTMRRRVVGRGI